MDISDSTKSYIVVIISKWIIYGLTLRINYIHMRGAFCKRYFFRRVFPTHPYKDILAEVFIPVFFWCPIRTLTAEWWLEKELQRTEPKMSGFLLFKKKSCLVQEAEVQRLSLQYPINKTNHSRPVEMWMACPGLEWK